MDVATSASQRNPGGVRCAIRLYYHAFMGARFRAVSAPWREHPVRRIPRSGTPPCRWPGPRSPCVGGRPGGHAGSARRPPSCRPAPAGAVGACSRGSRMSARHFPGNGLRFSSGRHGPPAPRPPTARRAPAMRRWSSQTYIPLLASAGQVGSRILPSGPPRNSQSWRTAPSSSSDSRLSRNS